MAWNLITSGIVAGNGAGGALNSPTFNGMGADLAIMVGGAILSGNAWATDSQSNLWQYGTYQGNNVPEAQIAYLHNPIVSSSMTVGIPSTQTHFTPFAYFIFSGSIASGAVLDVQNGNNSGATQPGSITPSQNGSLIIAAIADQNSGGDSVTGGFSTPLQTPLSGGVSYGLAAAYLVQGTAAAINPTWTSSNGLQSNVIAAFKPSNTSAPIPALNLLRGWSAIPPIPMLAAAALVRNPILSRRRLIQLWHR